MELPFEIKQYIHRMLLRLMLDDFEDNPLQLISTISIHMGYFGGAGKQYYSANNIESYIKLLQMRPINTNVNVLSYKGNSIFHLLTRIMLKVNFRTPEEEDGIAHLLIRKLLGREQISSGIEAQHLKDKQSLLCKCSIDINMKNNDGDTIAHQLITIMLTNITDMTNFKLIMEVLLKLKLDVGSIKNNAGFNAYQLGNNLLNQQKNNYWESEQIARKLLLNDLLALDIKYHMK